MTVTYIQHCHTAGKLGAFLRLLAIWRGSVFQVIWKDLVVFCSLYGLISLSYRLGFSRDESMKLIFEKVCFYFGKYGDYIPLAFILGFYVSQVVTRWWSQFNTIPWPDTIACNLLSYMPGHGRQQRIR